MKKISKKQLQKILNSLTFFDYKNYKPKNEGKLAKISFPENDKGDSGYYDFKSKKYKKLENNIKKYFQRLLKNLFIKNLFIKAGHQDSWFTPGRKGILSKEKKYSKFIEFIEKNSIPSYFEGAFLLEKKEIDTKLMELLIEMNVRNLGNFDFILDNDLVISINHHMEFFIFYKDNKKLKKISNKFIKS